MESHNSNDAKWRWCSNCDQFHMAIMQKEPIYFDAIVERIQYAYRRELGANEKFSICHESYEENGMMWYRSFVKVGSGVVKCSQRPHVSIQDSLRELAELVDADIGRRMEFTT